MNQKTGFFSRIKALSLWQKTLFATALTERMLPNYQLFAQLTEQEDGEKVAIAIDLLWQHLSSRNFKLNYDRMLNQLDELIPEATQYDIYAVQPAIDAIVSICTILTARQQKIETDLINISKLSSSTIAGFIEASEQPDLEGDALDDFIFAHPLMAEEREIQLELLSWIEQLENQDFDAIKALRKDLRDSGISNLGLSL